nr:MAG TPA: hypothetical protein [Caudoviricetes sp.]
MAAKRPSPGEIREHSGGIHGMAGAPLSGKSLKSYFCSC